MAAVCSGDGQDTVATPREEGAAGVEQRDDLAAEVGDDGAREEDPPRGAGRWSRVVARWSVLTVSVAGLLTVFGTQCPHCGAPVIVCRTGILATLAVGALSSSFLMAVRAGFERAVGRLKRLRPGGARNARTAEESDTAVELGTVEDLGTAESSGNAEELETAEGAVRTESVRPASPA